MDGEFPEQFKCPICFEIPEKEIYQCENGHTICDNCVKGLSLCPQCRVSLNTKNIRNRALEELLDMMKFNCSFKSEGCVAKVTRKEMSNHLDDCTFGREQVPLCRYLGYACKYKLKTRNLQDSLQHLKNHHSILSKKEKFLDLTLTNANKIDRKVKGFWKPIILNVHSNHYMLVVYSNSGNISFTFVWIGGEGSTEVDAKFRIKAKRSKVSDLEWTTNPILQEQSEWVLKCPPLHVSMDSLLTAYVDANILRIEVVISDNISNAVSDKAVVELESFLVLPSPQPNNFDRLMSTESFGDITVMLLSQLTESIGDNHYCNVCRIKPIRGPRYQCIQCCDYDLCASCMHKNEHSFHHFTFLYNYNQVTAMNSKVKRENQRRPYFECGNNGNLDVGYGLGSVYFDARDLRCQNCENQPDYICLQCVGPCGLCRFCFLAELRRHDKNHFFLITMTDSARQFAIHTLRKHGILGRMKHELQE